MRRLRIGLGLRIGTGLRLFSRPWPSSSPRLRFQSLIICLRIPSLAIAHEDDPLPIRIQNSTVLDTRNATWGF
jgi:hypothetical protein